MTILEALKQLQGKGISKLVGIAGKTDIKEYIENAEANHKNAVKYAAEGVSTWVYALNHEDTHEIITTADGHYIIISRFDNFEMPDYSNYSTEDEMYSAFDEYCILEKAEAIASEMDEKRPGELPHKAWLLIAVDELRSEYKQINETFKREFEMSI